MVSMSSNDALKEIDIKNRTRYYFDDIIKIEDCNLDNILIDGKSHENILVYNTSYKTLIDVKPLCIRFEKIDGFNRVYDGTRYLVFFVSENYNSIYNIIFHNYAKIKVDSEDSLPLEKTITFHDVIILIKSVFNKNLNNF